MLTGFEWYAFISYSRTDEKWARWIQHRLETYRFPVTLKKEHARLPKKIFPIFRDKTDLTSGELWEELKKTLRESRYLIVICSPNSANAEWVNNEVKYFQSLGRNENIIPLIVDGEPHAKDSARECFCPALRDNPDKELLGVSIAELGKKNAVLRVIASIMQLRYDQLVMRDRKRAVRRNITAAALGVTGAAAAFGITWYNLPHSTYYRSFIWRNELPEGIAKVTRSERRSAYGCYRIIKQRGKIIRLEFVNSSDLPVSNMMSSENLNYPVIAFSYVDTGALSTVTYMDEKENPKLIKSYDGPDAVNFINPDNPSLIGEVPSGVDSSALITAAFDISEEKFSITRMLLTHDENGFLISERYMRDNRNTPACDSSGIFEVRYYHDETGHVIRKENLDRDGALLYEHAASMFCYDYDENGQIIRYASFNAAGEPAPDDIGVYSTEVLFDEKGLPAEQRYFGAEGLPCCDLEGVSAYLFAYDSNGFMTETSFFSEAGEPAYIKSMGVHRIVYENDRNGKILRQTNFRDDGSRMYDIYGVSSYTYTYDYKGRLAESRYYDVNDVPTIMRIGGNSGNSNSNMLSEGAFSSATYGYGGNTAGSRISYDGDDCIRTTYLDKDGKPTRCYGGYAAIETQYNENGLLKTVRFFDEEGAPVRASYNAAVIDYTYNDASSVSYVKYYDETGALCKNILGAAEVRTSYDYNGRPSSIQYYDENGVPCWVNDSDGMDFNRNFSGIEMEFNGLGQLAKFHYIDPKGKMLYRDGVAEQRMEYDERGNCIRYSNYNSFGNLTNSLSTGGSVVQVEYDELGRTISSLSMNKDGGYIDGNYLVELTYDDRGNIVTLIKYTQNTDGSRSVLRTGYEYDSRDNLCKESRLDENGKPIVSKDSFITVTEFDALNRQVQTRYLDNNGVLVKGQNAALTNVYDDFGNMIRMEQYDNPDGTPILSLYAEMTYDEYGNQITFRKYSGNGTIQADEYGIVGHLYTYDVMGNLVETCSCDAQGNLAYDPGMGWAVALYTHDNLGSPIRVEYLDENRMPMTRSSGVPAYIEQSYNVLGIREAWAAYDENGKLFDYRNDYAKAVITIDQCGLEVCQALFDENDQLLGEFITLPFIIEIQDGSNADKAGLQVDDIIVGYNDWDYFSYGSFKDAQPCEMTSAVSSGMDKEKHIKVCRVIEDDESYSFKILEFTLDPGLGGFTYESNSISASNYPFMKEAYTSGKVVHVD